MQAMVLYLLAAVGSFHTQALHATIQLWGERGQECHPALPGSTLGWALPHSSREGSVPFQSVPAPQQLPLPSDTLPSSPPEGSGRHLNPFTLSGKGCWSRAGGL